MSKKISLESLRYKCVRCNHKWIIRQPKIPRICPRCKLPWDKKGRGKGWRRGLKGSHGAWTTNKKHYRKLYDPKTKEYFLVSDTHVTKTPKGTKNAQKS